jgi:hypothetical protein
MNSQELRALQEAYSQVYAPQELDEDANYDRNRKRAAQRAAARNAARDAGKTGAVPGVGYVTPRRESETYRDSTGTERHKSGAKMPKKEDQKEQVDLYDIILSHLLDEGYAETPEAAEAIMVNMSEDWRESIVEGGYNNSTGRYDLGNGQTTGLLGGAIRQILSGNLPKQRTYIPPSPRQGTNTPPAVPPSKDDSGKSTDFGAGGGKAKMKTGMTVGQVERQGRMNKGDYSG